MPPPEASSLIAIRPEKSNLAEAQGQGLQNSSYEYVVDLKEDLSNCLSEYHENT